jgi:LytS/YehU family sensor histidine kinase
MRSSKILYIDDEADNLFPFRAVFRRYYNVFTANSGEEALKLLKKQSFDLVISDQRMPGMTGVELLQEVRRLYPDTIRMVMTGYSDMQTIIDAINQGNIYYYIAKPWNAEELKVVLDNALEAIELRRRNQQLEKAQVQAQFEILKNQINPHFLFNSMNTLSALIDSDTEKAKAFTHAFSHLYRSVLQLREQKLIDLRDELKFVDTYLKLQKIRFESGLQIIQDIHPKYHDWGIPPFALQTILENVFKHNMISEDIPMKIYLRTDSDQLEIRNDLRLRTAGVESTRTGLKNLIDRYELLGIQSPAFGPNGDQYIATIPLIPNG